VSYRTFRGPVVENVLFRVVLRVVEFWAAVKPVRARSEKTFILKAMKNGK